MSVTIAEAEENLDMGDADSVNNNKTGDQVRSNSKRNLKAVLPSMQPEELSRLIAGISIKYL
jgi:hypothetical protein